MLKTSVMRKSVEPGGEYGLIADGAVRQVAEADLDDEGRDRRRRLRRVERQVGLHPGGDGDDHRLADGARDGEDVGGDDAGERRRVDHPAAP